jgi:methylmalonyl-CoA mutase
MSSDFPDSPQLKDHFPNPSLEAWEKRACSDLGIEALADAAWGPDGGPSIPPLTRAGLPVTLEARPGWRYAELVNASFPGEAALGLKEASSGGADLAIVTTGPGGLAPRLLADVRRSSPLPVVASAGVLSPESCRLLAEANCAGYLVDPFSGHLRGEGPPDLEPAVDSPLVTTGRRCFAVDLRAWEVAGSPPIYQAAVAFAAASEWMVALTGRGLSGQDAAASLSVVVPVSHELFPSIALLRAVRAGVASVLQGFEVKTPIPIVGVTAEAAVEERDPYTNLIRTTTAAVASVIGAVDFLSIRPFDPANPTERDRGLRLARNIAHLLRHEGHLDKVADPASGSHYVEAMTRGLGAKAWALFADWERQGGLRAVLSKGNLLERLGAFRSERAQRLEDGHITRIGVNQYRDGGVSI